VLGHHWGEILLFFFFHFYFLASPKLCLHNLSVLFLILYPNVVSRRNEERPPLCSRAVTFHRYPRNREDVCHSFHTLGSVLRLSYICPSFVAFNTITHCFAYIYSFRSVRWTSFCSARSFSLYGLLQLRCSCLHVL